VHDSFNLLLLHFVCFQHFLRLQARLIAKTLKDIDKIAEDAAESKKFDASIEETSGSLVEVGFCCQLWSNISHIFYFRVRISVETQALLLQVSTSIVMKLHRQLHCFFFLQ
jgi:hypothetical protein